MESLETAVTNGTWRAWFFVGILSYNWLRFQGKALSISIFSKYSELILVPVFSLVTLSVALATVAETTSHTVVVVSLLNYVVGDLQPPVYDGGL